MLSSPSLFLWCMSSTAFLPSLTAAHGTPMLFAVDFTQGWMTCLWTVQFRVEVLCCIPCIIRIAKNIALSFILLRGFWSYLYNFFLAFLTAELLLLAASLPLEAKIPRKCQALVSTCLIATAKFPAHAVALATKKRKKKRKPSSTVIRSYYACNACMRNTTSVNMMITTCRVQSDDGSGFSIKKSPAVLSSRATAHVMLAWGTHQYWLIWWWLLTDYS